MNDEFIADFSMRYPSGATVQCAARRPVASFSIAVLFGPSGCGKTTVLRCLAGLETPQHGFIRFGGETWLDSARKIAWPPQQRRIGFVPQHPALFPHLTVADNIGFSLRDQRRAQRRETVDQALDKFELADLAGRRPHELSGGQQQRVALARAMARRPRCLLLDEPFSALDAATRQKLRTDLRRALADADIPVLFVTHDRIEAIALADELIVMDGGRIVQQGRATDVLSQPANVAAARIIGTETVEPGQVISIVDGLATVAVGGVHLLAIAGDNGLGPVYVCVRAEEVILNKDPRLPDRGANSARNHLSGVLTAAAIEGPMMRLDVDCGIKLGALVTRLSYNEMGLGVGDNVTALIKTPSIHLIDRSSRLGGDKA